MRGLAIIVLFILISCSQVPKPVEEKPDSSLNVQDGIESDSGYHFTEAFKGTLRCSDCSGVETEITFTNEKLSYLQVSKHQNSEAISNASGSYTTERGYKEDEDATLYVLDDDKRGHERYFLKWDDSTLLMLDSSRNIIDTTGLFKLHRTK